MKLTKEQMEDLEWLMGDDRNCSIRAGNNEMTVSFEMEGTHYEYYTFYADGSEIRVLDTEVCNHVFDIITVDEKEMTSKERTNRLSYIERNEKGLSYIKRKERK